jgi:Tfp pilus assembly protein PilF
MKKKNRNRSSRDAASAVRRAPTAAPVPSRNAGRLALGFAALVLLTFIAYLPVLQGGFIWDDEVYVTQNALVRTWEGLGRIWFQPQASLQYYPLTFTTFWLEYRLFGVQPLGYHVVNVLLQGVNAGLLWLVLRRLALPAAWITAAVFALHPVHVESVAWIAELKNLQSGLFYLLALLVYLGLVVPDAPDGDRFRISARTRYALAFVAFLGALASKTVTSTFPAAVLVLLWWKRGRVTGADLARLVPFVLVGTAAATTTSWFEVHRVHAQGAEWALSPAERILVAGRAWWFYVAKVLLPVRLTFIYPRWTIDPGQWWQWLFPLAAAAVLGLLWALRVRLGRAPLAAMLYFTITVAPALGFVNVYPMRYSFVADHFQYLASVGVIALVIGVVVALGTRLAATRALVLVRTVSAALLLVLGIAVWRQATVYRTLETLWRDTLAKNPSAWMAHDNLGLLLFDQGKLDEAAEHFRETLRLQPGFTEALYNLGNVALARGRLDEARDLYERTLRAQPRLAEAHNNLGNVYLYQGRIAQSIEQYEQALALTPNDVEVQRNLAIARSRASAAATP